MYSKHTMDLSYIYIIVFYWCIFKLGCILWTWSTIIKHVNEPGYGKKGHDYRIEDGIGAKWVTEKEKIYFDDYNQAIWDADHNNFYR